jgi:hypothetical protein
VDPFTPATRNSSRNGAFAKAIVVGLLCLTQLWTVFGLASNAAHKNQRLEKAVSCSYHKQSSPKPCVSLLMKPYELQLAQALKAENLAIRQEFCHEIIAKLENHSDLQASFICSNETSLHLNGEVDRHNVRVW